MKLATTSAALAVAASGAAAQDSWSVWASGSTLSKPVDLTKACPASITTYTTETTTAYEATSEVFKATVTVPVPDKPATVDIKPNWVDWATTTSPTETVTEAPEGCSGGKTVTSTTTVTSTKAGTTTVTHSTLFVGVQATGSADEAWANWNPGNKGSGSADDDSDSDDGSDSDSDSDSDDESEAGDVDSHDFSWEGNGITIGNGADNGNNVWNGNGNTNSGNSNGNSGNNGWGGDGNGNGNGGDGGWNGAGSKGSDNDGTNGNGGWGRGSWGGKGTGGKDLGSDNDVFHWDAPVATETKSGSAPAYTKNPDGSYSGTPWGDGSWGDWNGGNGDDSSDGSGDGSGSGSNGGKNGTSPANGGSGGKNSTVPDNGGTNSTDTYPPFGDPASNVTKPQVPLAGFNRCNKPGDRSTWCDGKSVETDYYQDYFTGRRCAYDLVITNGTWNQDGTDVMTFLINGQYPGPAIECNWGDLVTINVHNQLGSNGTAIHWHGVRQVGTNDQDGVPGVTECAIAPGTSRTYTWRASSYGTSWYHSHWGLQYGDGVQGPIIIHGPATADYDVDAGPVMIADTFGMSATAFGSIIAHVGPKAADNYLLNGKNVKADLSAGQHTLWKVQKGKKYLFRLINSAAQNMYSVSIDQHKLKVIAADFVPIIPYETEWLNIGIGQRYDVVVEMDQDVDSYFFRAVTQTLCPSASKNTGLLAANGIIAYEGVSESPLLLPTSSINSNKTAADFTICQDEPLSSLAPYLKKDAGTLTAFQSSASTLPGGTVQKVATADDGAVFRWFLNNGAMYINYTQPTLASLDSGVSLNSSVYANPIVLSKKDQWIYFVIQNQFFAFHPMHLHGHDFSVLGEGYGLFTSDMVGTLNFDNPIRRDTAMLKGAPAGGGATSGGYTVIGFETDNPGAWLMHCHIAWHVDQGLALQWLERPTEMKPSGYTSDAAFKEECSSYAAYEAEDIAHVKFSGQSGLRRRETGTYFDKLMLESSRSSVVRRDDTVTHYLTGHVKRGLGDGSNRRSFGRRR